MKEINTERILLVIPEYNDSSRLKPFLKQLCQELPEHYDILIVDDGSDESEKRELDNLIKEQLKVPSKAEVQPPISYLENCGKGAAIRRGFAFRKPCHKLLAFVDADGAISPKEILHLEGKMGIDPFLDALLASRIPDPSTTIERKWHRKMAGATFSWVVQQITKLPIKDTQCGLKFFKAASYGKIEPHLTIDGFPIDIEICCLLRHFTQNYKELPISWKEIEGSKVKMIKDSVSMLIETIKISNRVQKIEIKDNEN